MDPAVRTVPSESHLILLSRCQVHRDDRLLSSAHILLTNTCPSGGTWEEGRGVQGKYEEGGHEGEIKNCTSFTAFV